MTQNFKQSAGPSQPSRHAKANSRIIPVIPRQLDRKSKAAHQILVDNAPSKVESAEPSNASSNSSATSDANSVDSTRPTPSQSSTATSSETRSRSGTNPKQNEEDVNSGRRASDGTVKVDGELELTRTGASDGAQTVKSDTRAEPAIENHDASGTTEREASTTGPIELPAPIHSASQPDQMPAARSPPAGLEVAGDRSSFVFGGNIDSSAPSPKPPASAGSWNSSAGQRADGTLSPPPPFPMNGAYRSQPFTPSSGYSGYGHESHNSTSRPNLPPAFVPGPPAQYTPQGVPLHQRHSTHYRNLQSPRTGSIGSNAADSAYPVSPYPPAPYPTPYTGNGPVDSTANLQRSVQYGSVAPYATRTVNYHDTRNAAVADPDLPSLYALRSYSLSLFDHPTQTDCTLNIHAPDGSQITLKGHAAFLARSPKLRSQLAARKSANASETETIIDVPKDAVFRDVNAFAVALRYLYGGPMIRREHLPANLRSPKHVLEWILSYATAGWYLGMPEIATSGLAFATELMLIDNIDVALDFALTAVDNADDTVPSNPPDLPSQAPQLKYAPFAHDFLHSVTRFILFIISTNFEFERSAPELSDTPRIPPQLNINPGPFMHSSRQSVSNPRLSGIQLGDFQLHTSANGTMSSVLLSLPFPVLQSLFADRFLLERLTPDNRDSLLRAIVKEREHRREQALEVQKHLPKDEQERAEVRRAQGVLHFKEEVAVVRGEPQLQGRSIETNGSAAVT